MNTAMQTPPPVVVGHDLARNLDVPHPWPHRGLERQPRVV